MNIRDRNADTVKHITEAIDTSLYIFNGAESVTVDFNMGNFRAWLSRCLKDHKTVIDIRENSFTASTTTGHIVEVDTDHNMFVFDIPNYSNVKLIDVNVDGDLKTVSSNRMVIDDVIFTALSITYNSATLTLTASIVGKCNSTMKSKILLCLAHNGVIKNMIIRNMLSIRG